MNNTKTCKKSIAIDYQLNLIIYHRFQWITLIKETISSESYAKKITKLFGQNFVNWEIQENLQDKFLRDKKFFNFILDNYLTKSSFMFQESRKRRMTKI